MPVTSDEQLTEMVLRIMRKQLEDKMQGTPERLAAHGAAAAEREERRQ